MISTTPELRSALLIIRTAATVITAGWPKPRNILEGSMIRFDLSLPNTRSIINRVHNAIIETIS